MKGFFGSRVASESEICVMILPMSPMTTLHDYKTNQ